MPGLVPGILVNAGFDDVGCFNCAAARNMSNTRPDGWRAQGPP
jgi:hypothetical protein